MSSSRQRLVLAIQAAPRVRSRISKYAPVTEFGARVQKRADAKNFWVKVHYPSQKPTPQRPADDDSQYSASQRLVFGPPRCYSSASRFDDRAQRVFLFNRFAALSRLSCLADHHAGPFPSGPKVRFGLHDLRRIFLWTPVSMLTI
jgi:hypothetical protein